jgi:hypothetical protein
MRESVFFFLFKNQNVIIIKTRRMPAPGDSFQWKNI